jgi:ABC-2 type transport system ATP-binding protein
MNTRTDIGTSPGAGAEAPAIHVHGLEKSYKDLQVLKGVDLEVARGSIFAPSPGART